MSAAAAAAPDGAGTPASLWRGRALLVVGIVLLGVSLRSAVTGMSPFLPEIRQDLGMGTSAATFLGMLPTLFFGLAGFSAPVLIRRSGLEVTAVAAAGLAALGLAGFAMGVGYLFGTLGPLLGGWLDAATGGWRLPLLVYAATSVPMLLGAWQMCRPGRFLEDAGGGKDAGDGAVAEEGGPRP